MSLFIKIDIKLHEYIIENKSYFIHPYYGYYYINLTQ